MNDIRTPNDAPAHAGSRDGMVPARPLPALVLAATGVVFGDIGTSPLYAFEQAFHLAPGMRPEPAHVLGVLSLMFWALALVVSLKYTLLLMRADNRGEGGVLALLSLVLNHTGRFPRLQPLVALAGVAGACLFLGDAMITPAMSVLSAVEGLEVAAPHLGDFVLPLTVAVLAVLFWSQRFGTASIGALFGPVMLVWFLVLGLLGAVSLARHPDVLMAVSPLYALRFVALEPGVAFVVLGAVVLTVTGAEALYADMGHFGRPPIRVAWLGLVWPALLLNYFGQGALVLRDPTALANPFYLMAPPALLVPLLLLATLATVIASQAVISGAFSLTRQAILLGYLPRLRILHTSARSRGQVYVPLVNGLLGLGVLLLVLGFGSSERLAAAYGIAVNGAMLVDTLFLTLTMLLIWRWRPAWVLPLALLLFGVDLALMASNLMKIPAGGWLPLLVAALLMLLFTTWHRGRERLTRPVTEAGTLREFVDRQLPGLLRVPGCAVYLSRQRGFMPPALVDTVRHFGVLHEQVVVLTMEVRGEPRVSLAERLEVRALGGGVWRVFVRFGFLEEPDVPEALRLAGPMGLTLPEGETRWLVAREIVSAPPGVGHWRAKLFALMQRNTGSAVEYLHLPPERVLETGVRVAA